MVVVVINDLDGTLVMGVIVVLDVFMRVPAVRSAFSRWGMGPPGAVARHASPESIRSEDWKEKVDFSKGMARTQQSARENALTALRSRDENCELERRSQRGDGNES